MSDQIEITVTEVDPDTGARVTRRVKIEKTGADEARLTDAEGKERTLDRVRKREPDNPTEDDPVRVTGRLDVPFPANDRTITFVVRCDRTPPVVELVVTYAEGDHRGQRDEARCKSYQLTAGGVPTAAPLHPRRSTCPPLVAARPCASTSDRSPTPGSPRPWARWPRTSTRRPAPCGRAARAGIRPTTARSSWCPSRPARRSPACAMATSCASSCGSGRPQPSPRPRRRAWTPSRPGRRDRGQPGRGRRPAASTATATTPVTPAQDTAPGDGARGQNTSPGGGGESSSWSRASDRHPPVRIVGRTCLSMPAIRSSTRRRIGSGSGARAP
jgi:hypothetical protein